MPLIDLNLMLGERRKKTSQNWSANTFFAEGFNGKHLLTSGIPSLRHAASMESEVRETRNPSSGNVS